MELEESQEVNHKNLQFFQKKNEPSISFSPDKSRFESNSLRTLSVGSMDMEITNLLVSGRRDVVTETQSLSSNNLTHQPSQMSSSSSTTRLRDEFSGTTGTHLQKRLERHIAHAKAQGPANGKAPSHPLPSRLITNTQPIINPPESTNGKHRVQISPSLHQSSSSVPDIRNKALLPPQRLAVPRKPNSTGSSAHLNSQEAKPLVQWDTDDSEEELSFFPQPKARLTDNLSIDNLSLSGEEEDLHLTPPRPLPTRCPCDPRHLLQSHLPLTTRTAKQCHIT